MNLFRSRENRKCLAGVGEWGVNVFTCMLAQAAGSIRRVVMTTYTYSTVTEV